MTDSRVLTWYGKQVQLDKDLLIEATEGETTPYYMVCLSPQSIWLLLTLLEFYTSFPSRFVGFEDQREVDQLHADALRGLICAVACEQDIQDIVAQLVIMNDTQAEIWNTLGGEDGDLNLRLTEIETALQTLNTTVALLDPLIDKIEPILNGVGVILGAPDVPLNGG